MYTVETVVTLRNRKALLSIAQNHNPAHSIFAPPKFACAVGYDTCHIVCIVEYRVVSGQPVARPPVVSLCCGVARRVVDKFGPGVTDLQAEGVAEALVSRLDRGIDGERARGKMHGTGITAVDDRGHTLPCREPQGLLERTRIM